VPAVPSERRLRLVAALVSSTLFMQEFDSAALLTVVPTIAKDFGESPVRLSAAVLAYLLALLLLLPLSGWICDRVGCRRVFNWSILIFIAGAVLCSQADSLVELSAARFVQGLGGALMVPASRLIILRMATREQIVTAMVWFSTPALLGPLLGPPLGGLLAVSIGWRWIFVANVPIAFIAIVLAWRLLPTFAEEAAPPLDVSGLVLLASGLALLVMGIQPSVQSTVGLPSSLGAIALGFCALSAYVVHSKSAGQPIVDFNAMNLPSFRYGTLGGCLFVAGVGAGVFIVPILLQRGLQYPADVAGMAMLGTAIGALAMRMIAKRILSTWGFRSVLAVNAVAASAAFSCLALVPSGAAVLAIFALMVTIGFSRSLQYTGFSSVMYVDVDPSMMSRASTLSGIGQQLSFSLGIGLGALLLSVFATDLATAPSELAFAPPIYIVSLVMASSFLLFIQLPSAKSR
jgi:EmrB/QacA subfamily drug resistance transporter